MKGEDEAPSSAAAVNVRFAVGHAQDFIRTPQVLSTGEKGFTVAWLAPSLSNTTNTSCSCLIILDKLEKKLCLNFPGRERKFVFLKNSIFLSSLREIIVSYTVWSYILFKANFSLNKLK